MVYEQLLADFGHRAGTAARWPMVAGGRMRGAQMALVATVAAAVLLGGCGGGADRLTGTGWTLATLDGRGALPQATARIRFDDASHFSGSTGCNSLRGTWKSSGSDISFSEISTTLIGCPGPIGNQEAAFNTAFGATRSYAIESGTLLLKDGSAALRMTFEARADATP
jgi:heat shock protein HslJ